MNKNQKIKLIILSFCFCFIANSQEIKIDATNYCMFYDTINRYPKVKIFYLNETKIIDIVTNEMKKLGFQWVSSFRIIEIDDKHIISICYSDKSNCGFLLDDTFDMIPKQENRNIVSLYKTDSGNDYSEKIVLTDGKYEFDIIKEIPKNLHILKMDNYWYQTSDDEEISKRLVSKEFIEELLRQDVRDFLKDFKR
jgi:hypothetical protein